MIVKSDGQRRLHLRRPGLLPRQARARLRPVRDHARRRPPRLRRPDDGDVRRVRRRARREPRDPHRPDGQPGPRRRAAADVQAGRQRHHARRPGRGDRRRRRPLRAGALLARLQPSTSTSTSGPRRPATTRSTTCSTPTPGSRRSCATRADLGLAAGRDDVRPGAARPREGGRAAAGAGRVPARRRAPRPSCASRTGWPATWRTTAASYHRFYDSCRVLPDGRRGADRPAPRPAAARRGHADRARQRPGLLGVSAPERM